MGAANGKSGHRTKGSRTVLYRERRSVAHGFRHAELCGTIPCLYSFLLALFLEIKEDTSSCRWTLNETMCEWKGLISHWRCYLTFWQRGVNLLLCTEDAQERTSFICKILSHPPSQLLNWCDGPFNFDPTSSKNIFLMDLLLWGG